MPLAGITHYCFGLSYAIALLLELLQLVWPRTAQRLLATGFGAVGLFTQTVFLGHALFFAGNRSALISPLVSLLLLSWVLAIFYVYGSLHYSKVAWGVFVLPVIIGLVVLSTVAERTDKPPEPGLWAALLSLRGEQFWSFVHGTLLLLAAVGVCIGFVASVMYLIQAHRLRAKVPPGRGLRLLSLERLEEMNRRAVNLAFPLLTAGVLVGVVLMFQHAEDVREWTDPRLIGGAVLWLVVGLLLYLRYFVHSRGRRLAVVTIIAFALLVLALASAHTPVQGGTP